MAKITRVFQKLFGSSAGASEIGQFGSLAAGTPTTTTDPDVIQGLSNFLDGWFGAVLGDNSPPIEDMNGLFFLAFRQLAYIFQAGISEYDASTTYYQYSVCSYNGNIYVSKTDNNTGNTPSTSTSNWKMFDSGVRTVTSSTTLLATDNVILVNCTSGNITLTFPAASGLSGKKIRIKQIDTSGNQLTLVPTGGDLIDQETSQVYTAALTAVDWVSDGSSNWFGF